MHSDIHAIIPIFNCYFLFVKIKKKSLSFSYLYVYFMRFLLSERFAVTLLLECLDLVFQT